MNFKFSAFSKAILMVAALAIFAPFAGAQSQVASRITQAVDNTRMVTLKGNTHPMARPEFDRGRVADSLPLNKMVLVLQRSPEQQATLSTLLDQQHDKTSASYHKWLTPVQFGRQFGPSDSDMQTVTQWLQSQGFRVDKVSNGRTVIEFSGDAGQVRTAFHTEIHNYMVRGVNHIANQSDPQVPAALAPVVRGVAALHNFFTHPELVRQAHPVTVRYESAGKSAGHLTFSAGDFALGPGDFAKIYNVPSAATGAGKTIAIVGRSNINVSDVTDFQTLFGLTANPPTVVVTGPDPGDLGGGEEIEALLDNEWANAISNGATVKFVISESTETDDGVMLSARYIVDNDMADIMTQSFGICETGLSSGDAAAVAAIPEQAAAQGISYFASTGDAGAEDCDNPDSEEAATGPISVDVPGVTPFVTAVGGTQFNEHGDDAAYWNPSTSVATTALQYIPEDVWNQSCASGASACSSPNIGAAGGGVSTVYTSANGFPKPAWQAGVSGVTADNARDIPDVSLNASAAHDPYIVCQGGGCVPSGGEVQLNLVGGTSASTPSFAGIMALVDNHQNSREGLANYVLYKLAATETFSNCNGSSTTATVGSTCIFNDVTVGNNAVPGEAGYGTTNAKYKATVGYDAASGLGSVNVTNLINDWANATFLASTTTLSLSSAAFTHGTPVTASGAITTGGSNAPTGQVAFLAAGTTLAGVGDITLSGGSGTTTNYSTSVADLPGGTYTVTARYAGDTHVAASVSNAVPVVVSPEASTSTLSILQVDFVNGTFQPVSSAPVGSNIFVRVDVAGASGQGTPTGTVHLVDSLHTGTAADNATLTLNSEGYAEFQTAALTSGNHSFVATYVGDPSFTGSASAAATLSIVPGSFSLALSPNTGTIASAGGTATSTVTVSDSNDFAGNVALSCSVSGSGTQPTCSLNKSSVALSESTLSATATLTVTAPASARHIFWPIHFPGVMGLIAATLGLVLTTMLFWMAAPARKRLSTVLALIVFGTIIGMSACGGGTSSGGGGGNGSSTTSKVTVKATSGSTTQSQTFTVTVQ
jgi:hypothetical protein